MPPTLSLVLNQIVASMHVLQNRSAQVATATMVAMTLISIATAPGTEPGFWSWIGLLVISILAMLATLTWVASRTPFISPDNRQYRLTASVTLGVLALALNVFYSFPSTLLLVIGLVVLGRHAGHLRPGAFPWLLSTALVTFVPWWIWSALGAWDAGLLVLVPLAALAWLSGGHIRAAYRSPEDDVRAPLSMRGHRLGAWMGMLLGGILIVVSGLIGDASNAWIALGGILMAVAVALEAGMSQPDEHPGTHSTQICDGVFAVVAICWLISIT